MFGCTFVFFIDCQEYDSNRAIEEAAKRAQEDAEWKARYKEREELRQQQLQEKLLSSPPSPSPSQPHPDRLQRSDLNQHAHDYDDDRDDEDEEYGYTAADEEEHRRMFGDDEDEVVDDFDEEPDMHSKPRLRSAGTGQQSQSSSQQYSAGDPRGKQEAGLNRSQPPQQRDDAGGLMHERSPIVQNLWMNSFGETEEFEDELDAKENYHL